MRRVRSEQVRRAMPPAARAVVDPLLHVAEGWDLEVFLVGGPVRDYLLGRGLRDVDLTVVPRGQHGAAELARKAASSEVRVIQHDRFGTVRLEAPEAVVDLATTRTETYPASGELPRVGPGDLDADLRRRDFTVNALAIPLTGPARRGRGDVIDPGDGLADLQAGVLRVFHPRSFHDDPTRALRAARLGPRLGFSMARGTRAALRAALRDGAFGAVSGERFRAEFEKLFSDPRWGLDPARALSWLADGHVLAALEPGLVLSPSSLAPLRRLGRLTAEPAWPPQGAAGTARPLVAGLMVCLAPLAAPLRRRVLRRLAVRGELARRIGAFPRARDATLRSLSRGRGRGAADQTLGRLDEDTLLALAASPAANLRRRILRWASEDRNRKLPLTGDDLLEIGLRGREVGRALARLRLAWLDRTVRDRSEALALARELAGRARVRRS